MKGVRKEDEAKLLAGAKVTAVNLAALGLDESAVRTAAMVAGWPAAAPTPVANSPFRPVRLAIDVLIPVRLVSEANVGRTLKAKVARKSKVKAAVADALPALAAGLPLPATVTLTRVGGRELDSDNLAHALKPVRDVVAAWLGLPSDRDGRVRWKYRQRPGYSSAVAVRVESAR